MQVGKKSQRQGVLELLAILAVPVVLTTALTACGEVEDTKPGQPVKHRQQAFKAILRSFEPMGVMLRDKKYQPEAFDRFVAELAKQKDAPWDYFGADTQYPPSKAKDAVWQEAAEFTKAKEAFLQRTEALVKAAATKDEAQIQPAYQAVYETCQGCHRQFKQR